MITDDRIRELVAHAEDHFEKIGPVYALTELITKLTGELDPVEADVPTTPEVEQS